MGKLLSITALLLAATSALAQWSGTVPRLLSPATNIVAVFVSEFGDSDTSTSISIHHQHEFDGNLGGNCAARRFIIWAGNGNLNDPAQVRLQQAAVEVLDAAKLALITRSPVRIVVNTGRKTVPGNVCQVTSVRLLPKIPLSVHSVASTSAMLQVPPNPDGVWWYKRTLPATGTRNCTLVGNSRNPLAIANFSGLTASTTYSYSLWSIEGCEGFPSATVTFTTPAS